ncbi:sigma D regulator [Alkalimarinus alittae]|uniref:Sigma D regulator n=1 Tax=Alkalimarinus alittae TaxID=2961619 RepID=A0ABY6N2W1_9ALTE|nr:sigma D regulator [Alkalimarinus alittae]UZE96423.1 sigma D regulator [Alkalimarinus alittae]
MLENCRNAKERWGGVSDIVDKWLKERQDLIVLYCDITSTEGESTEALVTRYQHFCQLLVDYVSAGHFEVYEQLIQEAKEFDDGGLELAKKIIPQIEQTTEIALKFNDQFDNVHKVDDGLGSLVSEMSRLGEVLADRFELEDAMLEALHNAHADQVV